MSRKVFSSMFKHKGSLIPRRLHDVFELYIGYHPKSPEKLHNPSNHDLPYGLRVAEYMWRSRTEWYHIGKLIYEKHQEGISPTAAFAALDAAGIMTQRGTTTLYNYMYLYEMAKEVGVDYKDVLGMNRSMASRALSAACEKIISRKQVLQVASMCRRFPGVTLPLGMRKTVCQPIRKESDTARDEWKAEWKQVTKLASSLCPDPERYWHGSVLMEARHLYEDSTDFTDSDWTLRVSVEQIPQ